MSKLESDLDRWLRSQCARDRTVPLERFCLRHALAGKNGEPVEEFQVPEGLNGDNLALFRDEILGRAQSDADGLGSKLQRFVLVACEAGSKSGTRFAFRLRGQGEDEDDGDGEEPATEKGLLSQMMRHNESLMRMATMGATQQLASLQRQNEHLSRVVEEMAHQRREDVVAIEAAKSESHERDMQMLLTSGSEERKASLFKNFEQLIPIMLNKIAGKAILTEQEHSVLAKFVDTLTEDQIKGIAGQLGPEQQAALFHMYNAVKQSAKEKSTNGAS